MNTAAGVSAVLRVDRRRASDPVHALKRRPPFPRCTPQPVDPPRPNHEIEVLLNTQPPVSTPLLPPPDLLPLHLLPHSDSCKVIEIVIAM